ncbi:MAG: RNA polymerase sigma factor [Chitinophagaceae bacterium]|nr:RNA polymerase sigma factor [Chitinophagaceae bacterium]
MLLEEIELVRLLQNGDRAAFKTLVTRWQDMVYNTALGLMQNESDAEDVAQEVFVKVFEAVNSFKGESKLSTWLYQITIRKSLDALRKKKRKKRFSFIYSLYNENDELIHDPPDFVHPGVMAENKEDAEWLFKAVKRLPENQKTAFILNKMETLSYNEVGEIMNLSTNAVDALLQRAKKNLKKYLSDLLKEQ